MKNIRLNNLSRLLIIVFFISLVLFNIYNVCYASDGEINTSIRVDPSSEISDLKGFAGTIIGFIQWVGSAVAVIVVIVVGIKYMISSVEEKAEYKKTALFYIIGALLVFGGINILSFVYNLLK